MGCKNLDILYSSKGEGTKYESNLMDFRSGGVHYVSLTLLSVINF
jgi:hypothetical protein